MTCILFYNNINITLGNVDFQYMEMRGSNIIIRVEYFCRTEIIITRLAIKRSVERRRALGG